MSRSPGRYSHEEDDHRLLADARRPIEQRRPEEDDDGIAPPCGSSGRVAKCEVEEYLADERKEREQPEATQNRLFERHVQEAGEPSDEFGAKAPGDRHRVYGGNGQLPPYLRDLYSDTVVRHCIAGSSIDREEKPISEGSSDELGDHGSEQESR